MRKTQGLVLVALLLLAGTALLLGQGAVGAQGTGYDLSWWSVDGGGGTFSTGGGYSLGGTAGQADPGVLANGGYNLGGGFWRGGKAAGVRYNVYLPVVLDRAP